MIWILDAGHGIETPGKRSPGKWSPTDGQPGIMEYEFNRDIVSRIACVLEHMGIPAHVICQDEHTMTLKDRKKIAKTMVNEWEGHAALISVHANAAGNGGWSDARGLRVFTPKKPKGPSKQLANLMTGQIALHSGLSIRSVKSAGFAIINGLPCPAVLTENGFMTNRKDCAILSSEKGRIGIAEGHINAILRFQEIVMGQR